MNLGQYCITTLINNFAPYLLVQHGPFVMNTREEISQTIEDYQMGKNGFEMAHRWKSVEGNK